MTDSATQTGTHIVAEVAPDAMSARVHLQSPPPGTVITAEQVLSAVKQAGIALNQAVTDRVAEFVRLITSSDAVADPFVIAEGKQADQGRDEELIWDDAFASHGADWQGDSPVNYYTLNAIVTVEKGTVIGTVRKMVPAEDGVDVKGQIIKPAKAPRRLELDNTLCRSAQSPQQIIASAAGRVVQQGNKLHIEEVLHLSGDVSFSTGNIDSSTDVFVAGNVPDRFEARSAGSITVGGTVEAATIHAAGDVAVKHGIVGRGTGLVSAGGGVVATFCSDAHIVAERDIKVAKQVLNCRLRTGGRLVAEHAALIGGHLYAKEGVDVAVLGSDAATPTRIFVGCCPDALREAEAIEGRLEPIRQAIEKTRERVQPLLNNMKRLTPTQREQATELMFKADEAAARVEEEEQRRDALLQTAGKIAPINVSQSIFAKVTISFGTRVATFDHHSKGPIRLELRKVNNTTELVAIQSLTGSIRVLSSQVLPLKKLLEQFEPLQQAMPTPAS